LTAGDGAAAATIDAASPGTAGVRPLQLYIDAIVGAACSEAGSEVDVERAAVMPGAWNGAPVPVLTGETPAIKDGALDMVVARFVAGSELTSGGE
jgi:hypothetical protein